jgi:steroid delta-isomerase-like uncharacterized protein
MNNVARITLAAVLSIAALAVTPALAANPTPEANGCSQAHRAEVEAFADLYIEVYNSHDLSRFDEVMTPEALNYNPLGVMTVEELTATMEGFYAAFPDLEYQLEDVVIDGDEVVIEYTYTGTHLGPLMGVPATGTVVHGRGLEVHEFEDGRIALTRNYSDVFGLFAQLGLVLQT